MAYNYIAANDDCCSKTAANTILLCKFTNKYNCYLFIILYSVWPVSLASK